MSAFVRLGTKYDIRKLRIEGQRIFKEFPTDLADMAADIVDTWNEEWFEVVKLARITGLLSILPFALYVCCKIHRTSEILGGFNRSNGTIDYLSNQDQLACLAGFQAICKAQAETTYSWAYIEIPPAGCTSSLHVRDKYLKVNFTSLPAIEGLENFDKSHFRRTGLCVACVDQAVEMQKNWARKN